MKKSEIDEIISFVDGKEDYLSYAYRMYDIYNKNLTPYVLDRLFINFKSQTSRNEAATRLSPINILPKLVNKLSKVYSNSDVKITTDFEASLEAINEDFDLTSWRSDANKMLNLNGCCALEPVFDDSNGFIRVLPAYQFLVYSNDVRNPNRITHFIKIVKNSMSKSERIYHVFTSDEFLEMDGTGKVLRAEPNFYGVIPFVYLKRDSIELMPRVGRDDYEMVTLLPLLLTDANFSLKYKAYSILYVLNAEAPNIELAPNAIWAFKSTGQDGDKVEIGQIKPTLAIEEVLNNISTQYTLWLETKNLKSPAISGGQGGLSIQNMSGIAKVIDEADVTDDVSAQRSIFKKAEKDLLKTISFMAEQNGKEYNLFDAHVSFDIKDIVPETPRDKIDRIVVKLANRLTSWTEAIREANNMASIDNEAIDAIKKDILLEYKEWNNGDGRVGSEGSDATKLENA